MATVSVGEHAGAARPHTGSTRSHAVTARPHTGPARPAAGAARPADPAGASLEWGVLHEAVDAATGAVHVEARWGLPDAACAAALAARVDAGEFSETGSVVHRNAHVVHRWVGAVELGVEPRPAPPAWDLVESLVLQLARATGRPEAAVRLGMGLPLPHRV
ncbi:hypothetical protein [Cellulomonas endophytica]|uniref:hypothetical protein n=1 Tax=Cellulomonas endophytica TaxID=2494735 RepID=UPI0010118BD0|nr:hypothetical protein [Cellulomonas endophytica]